MPCRAPGCQRPQRRGDLQRGVEGPHRRRVSRTVHGGWVGGTWCEARRRLVALQRFSPPPPLYCRRFTAVLLRCSPSYCHRSAPSVLPSNCCTFVALPLYRAAVPPWQPRLILAVCTVMGSSYCCGGPSVLSSYFCSAPYVLSSYCCSAPYVLSFYCCSGPTVVSTVHHVGLHAFCVTVVTAVKAASANRYDCPQRSRPLLPPPLPSCATRVRGVLYCVGLCSGRVVL